MSAGWRKPMDCVPAALHYRPLHLIKHMREVGMKAELITPGSINRQSNRLFTIKGSATIVYNTDIGDENTMPSCSCHAFRKTHMPCKHFAAVFKKYDDVSFTSLPIAYTGNPIFILDEDVCSKAYFPVDEIDVETPECTMDEIDVETPVRP